MQNPFQLIKKLSGKNIARMIFAIIVLLVIWFVLPVIPIGGTFPFAGIGVRSVITGLLALGTVSWIGIGLLQRYKGKSFTVIKEKSLAALQSIKSFFNTGWQYGKEYYGDLHDKVRRERKHRRLKRLPWYLILGAEQSGKRSIVQNTGLYFQKPEHIGEEAVNYINQFPDFEWWFSNQAVLIDAMNNDQENSVTAWKKFVKLLKRERRNKPFNGIILSFSIVDLLLYSNQKRQDFLQQLSNYIRDIYSVFKAHVPVYIIFNKCDLVEGFMEFFENLSKEELNQVWGMTLPIEECNDLQFSLNFFNREYTVLLDQLRKRVMWSFDTERTMRGRELINAFPQQMQLFRKPIENFIAELFGATRYHKAVQLRGLYFTSCTQGQGESYDFLLQAMSKKFQLVPPTFKRPVRVGESYFLRSLLFEIMLPEASMLGDSERRKKIRQFFYRSTLIGSPVLIIALWVGMHTGYKENVNNLKNIKQYIYSYNMVLANLQKKDSSVVNTLPVLNQLQQAKELYTRSNHFGLSLLYASHQVKTTLRDTEQRALHSLFLPRIAAQLENNLRQNIKNQNLLYADFKGYLAYSAADYTNRYALKAPMEYAWNQSYIAKPKIIQQLDYYLNLALKTPIGKLPLDQTLINRIRGQLEQIIPSQRAYGLLLLRSNVSKNPDILLHTAVGSNFNLVFSQVNPTLKVPSLYTEAAYTKLFLKQYEAIADEVAEDNRDIGLASSNSESNSAHHLKNTMEIEYNRRYLKAWDDILANTKVRPFSSLDEAVKVLTVLTGKQSPLNKLLNVIYDNTNIVSHGKVNVAANYTLLNNYSQKNSNVSWKETLEVLTKLRDYLLKLQQSPNQNQASFNAVKNVILGKAKSNDDPMRELAVLASKAPQPVKRWLKSLSNNCWQIIISSAHQQMNSAWQKTIMATYDSSMRGRYPFNRHSNANVTLNSFNSVFGNGGALQQYFEQYIKPFVNTEGKSWKQINLNGLTIELPKSSVELFKTAVKIRNQFFSNGAKKAHFTITVKPLTLDKRASSVELSLGTQQLAYSHGPQRTSTVNWPLPFNSETSRLVINTFNSDQYYQDGTGPWSLFKIFSHGVFKPTRNRGVYYFYVNFNGYYASYQITGPNDIGLFKLSLLKGLSLPENIAPTVVTGKNKGNNV